MFFVLSKTLNLLFLPVTQVFIFFVLCVIVKKQPWKKRFFWAGFILFFFFSNDFISNEVMRVWEVDTKLETRITENDLIEIKTHRGRKYTLKPSNA